MPEGELNSAAVPVPSAEPDIPVVLPASVVTAPVAITIFFILLLLLSATYILVPSVTIPEGELNSAAVAGPEGASVLPDFPD